MKRVVSIWCVLSALVLSTPAFVQAQGGKSALGGSSPLKDAVILIIRHAEKPESGQGLSLAGGQRAEAYVNYFKNFQVDAKPLKLDCLFATADSKRSQRPRLTVEPLGKALGLKIDSRFKNKEFQELVDEIESKDHGKGVLICWHHGEIAELVRALGADPAKLLPGSTWPDDEFGWVLQLHYDHEGHLMPGETRRINENLMPGDAK
ncbi:MAG TPA: flagellar basal body-associated protein FliL [Verrucomicrobiae bacterium]|nr:flagellar basal body-associated protein FliL [Verrucomicrobiae bacterium]